MWQEDRREHFAASAHARDHVHYVDAAVTNEGVITGLRATIIVDVGAYSVWPWTSTIEPRMASAILPASTAFRTTPTRPTPWRLTKHRWAHTGEWHGRPPSSVSSGPWMRSPAAWSWIRPRCGVGTTSRRTSFHTPRPRGWCTTAAVPPRRCDGARPPGLSEFQA